jgi:hypothetical protein
MAMHFYQGLAFQSSQSHHPNKHPILMKWMELLHEGEMIIQKEIPYIDAIWGSPL